MTTTLIEPNSFFNDLLIVLAPVAVGAGAYLGLCLALGVEELDYVRRIVGQRFSRRG